MSVSLPAYPSFASCVPRLVSLSNKLTPPLGGKVQLILRPGDKFAADIVMPPMVWGEPVAAAWVSALMQGARDSVVFDWPQPSGGVGAPGAPQVKGASQVGASLLIDGMTPGYNIQNGQFFSVIVSGRRYLHMATALTIVSGFGEATVPFLPPLRVSPADNATVEIVQPKLEGLIEVATDLNFPIDTGHIVTLKFSITEIE